MDEVLIELDDDRRTSLERIGHVEHKVYLAQEDPDGTITLRPAVTELEARFLANQALVERIEENRRHPERLVRRQKVAQPEDGTTQPEDASKAS
ncbi:MAG: hypothetical protein QOH36_1236 [Actinomycetota bacterium]|nr:hypothetical protein [Actinomycetota bacterium]MEA2971966.1 hypothetical protein [Actinomycetota bacterium]